MATDTTPKSERDSPTPHEDEALPTPSEDKVLEETARLAREGQKELEADPLEPKPRRD